MELNINISSFKCLIHRNWLTKSEDDNNKYDSCVAFALQSIPGKILTFHVMTDYGMLRSRVPLSELFISIPGKKYSPDFLQLWDCFGLHITYHEYDYLYGKRCEILLKNKEKIWGTYMFTIDWHSNPYSEEPTDYKCGHVIVGDNGQIFCQPNNRLFWKDMNFITKPFPVYRILVDDTPIISVEAYSDRWVSDDTDSFYYDIKKAITFDG